MIGQHYYTWCQKGTGLEETPGFQTRAKSPSISQEVERAIKRYCSHYTLPRSLDALKTKVQDLTQDELERTPVSLHFYPIGQNLYGLTRIRLHPKQSGRGGNFFAHTLVFPKATLTEFGYNPFEIVRSGVFKDSDEDASKQLSDLPELPQTARPTAPGALMSPRVTDVKSLLSALVVRHQDRRPIILLPAKMEDAAVLIETVLLLLPEDTRSEMVFSTYEPDPYRLLDATDTPLQILATISYEEGGKFEFREDEYKTAFYVVNIPNNRMSEPTPACPEYVRLATLTEPGSQAYNDFDKWRHTINELRIGLTPGKWDALASVASLDSSSGDLEDSEWKSVAGVLAANCTNQASAKPALSLLSNKATPEMAREGLLLLAGKKKTGAPILWYLSMAIVVLFAIVSTYFVTRPKTTPFIVEKQEAMSTAKPSPTQLSQRESVKVLRETLAGKGVQVTESNGLISVKFDSGLFGDTDLLLPDGRAQLTELSKKIPRAQITAIHVEGVTDSRPVKSGAGYDNYDLGYRRALMVARELRATGLPSGLFRLVSSGPDNPAYPADPTDPRNRTVILRFEAKSR